MGKRHRRIRARSATGQVAGAATEKPGLKHAHRPRTGLPNMRSPRKPLSRSPEPNPVRTRTTALERQFHAPTGRRFDGIVESGDNTMVCTKQFCSYRDRAEDFASLNATVVGISSQSVSSHEDFAAKNKLNVPLLADVDKAVAKAYSAVMPGVGSTARAVIVIDEQGIVRHRHDHRLGLDYQTVDELKTALEALPGPVA